jgi:hypothetical protein
VGNDGLEQKEEPSSGGPKGEPTSDGQQSPTSPKGGQRAASDQDSSQDASQRSGGGAKSSQDSDRSEPSSPNQDDEPSPQPSSGGKQQSQRSGNRAGQDSTKPATRADDEGTDQDNRSSDRAEQSSTKPAQHNEDRANDGGQARDGQKPAGDRGGSRQDDSASGERPGEKGPPGSDRGKKDKSGESSSEGPARKVDSQDKAKRSEPDEREGTKNRARPQSRPASQTSWNASELLQRLWPGVGQLLKWIYWLALFLIVAYFVWRHGTQFVAALRNFVRSLQELWRRLFGGGEDSPVEEGAGEAAGPPAPRFSDFSDPFLTGQADQWTADEVVRYSFQALEAWARERGCERLPEQTPYEFARLLAARQRTLESEVLRMAELYNISAYGAANATTTSVRPLRRFWELLRTTPVTAS